MKYPITILYSVVLETLIQSALWYGFITDDLLFDIQLVLGLATLGLAISGIAIVLIRIISESTLNFWSFKTVLATLYTLINFVVFLGFMLKAVIDWVGDPHQLV